MEASAQWRSSRATTTVRSAAASAGLAQLGQQAGQFLLLPGGRGGELVGQFAAQGAQGRGERGERQSVGADLHAAAECHDGALPAGGGGELLDQPGLADPGLATDQQRLRLARGGAGERIVQRVQFLDATHEHRTDGPGLHEPEHRTRVRRRGTGFQ